MRYFIEHLPGFWMMTTGLLIGTSVAFYALDHWETLWSLTACSVMALVLVALAWHSQPVLHDKRKMNKKMPPS